jgi:general secretion pathway protein G
VKLTRRIQGSRRPRGMTLLEIIVVVAILGLLMGIVVINLVPTFNQAKVDRARMDVGNIMSALKAYYVKKGGYPDTGAGLKAVVDSQLLEHMPVDPWGHEYVYLKEGQNPVIRSNGPDEQPGTEDDISSKDLGAAPKK